MRVAWLKAQIPDTMTGFTKEFCDWGYTVVHPNLKHALNSDGKTWDGGGCPTQSEDDCYQESIGVETLSSVFDFKDHPDYRRGWNFTSGDDYHVIKCPTRELANEMANDLAGEVIENGVPTMKAVGKDYRNSIYHAWWNDGYGGGTFRTQGDPERPKTVPNYFSACYWHKNYPGPVTKKCHNVEP